MIVPLASYRLQFNPGFGFAEAAGIIDYLYELGISDIYASPIFKAKKGSSHGYDIVDPTKLNPDLGKKADFMRLARKVKSRGMGWIQDIVPNHVALDGENEMLGDILENGYASKFFNFFDINWEHPYEGLKGRLLVPFLGDLYGEALEKGEINLRYGSGGFSVNYYELGLPLRIESYTQILTHHMESLKNSLGDSHPDFTKFLGLLYSIKTLPSSGRDRKYRHGQTRFIKRILWELYSGNDTVREFIGKNLDIFNGKEKGEDGFNLLDALLSEQHFRLSFWKLATEEINYRRFFNINGLISLRMEDEKVFDFTHSLIFDLVNKGLISGLRVDHIDGLYDPLAYLERLRKKTGDIYIVVEKILEEGEIIPYSWPVEGTTGYEFIFYLNGLFCDKKNEKKFSRIYRTFTGVREAYEEILYERKKLIIEKSMTGDVDALALLLKKISSRDRYGSDISLYGLKKAMVELLSLFPVYRTYVSEGRFSDEDRAYISGTVKAARKRNPALLHELDFIEDFLMLRFKYYVTDEEKGNWLHFVMKFQQMTGPLMAKGFEDTTLYVYNRLLSLNEVGGSPERFGPSPEEFHQFNKIRAMKQPYSMNASSTHDTKRGEDVRARINVLSEMPEEFEKKLKKWRSINSKFKKRVNRRAVPTGNDEYFLYQTLLGAFPLSEKEYPAFRERIKEYMIKSVREAKVHTAWLKHDTDYEGAFLSFLDRILPLSGSGPFLDDFRPFQKKVAFYGMLNSLSQTLLKITSPGIPDIYRGTELWDLNLVDPDNRRPVDFKRRAKLFVKIKEEYKRNRRRLLKDLLSGWKEGSIKLFLIWKTLEARFENKDLFRSGRYVPLHTEGLLKEHVVAFARTGKDQWIISAAARFHSAIMQDNVFPLGREIWRDTGVVLPGDAPSSWKDIITGLEIRGHKTLPLADVFSEFPVSLLVGNA